MKRNRFGKCFKKYLSWILVFVIAVTVTPIEFSNSIFVRAAEKENISSVTVSGIDAPLSGMTPDYVGTLEEGAGYHFASSEEYLEMMGDDASNDVASAINNGILWYNMSTNTYMPNTEKFVAGKSYTFAVVLVAGEGYRFPVLSDGSIDCNITINSESKEKQYCSGNERIIVASFAKELSDPIKQITTVDISGVALPVGGNNPNYEGYVPEDANYHLATREEILAAGYTETQIDNYLENGIMWKQFTSDGKNIDLKKTDTFALDETGYYYNAILVPNEGYEFAPKGECSATLNGGEGKASIVYAEVAGAIFVISNLYTASDAKLEFEDSDDFDIPEGPVSVVIEEIKFASAVSGGTLPYTFSIEAGPDWIDIDKDTGVMYGSRTETDLDETTATVQVKDAKGNKAQIEIKVGKGIVRQKIEKIVATSDISNIFGVGKEIKNVTFSVIEGAPVILSTGYPGTGWQKKNAEDNWITADEGTFTSGTWRYYFTADVDAEMGKNYFLSNDLTITIDGSAGKCDSVNLYSAYLYSAEMTIDGNGPMTIEESERHDIPEAGATTQQSASNVITSGNDSNPIQSKIVKGKIYTVKFYKYKITTVAGNKTGNVTCVGTTKSKKITSLSIGKTVKIGGETYKITAISDKAFMNYKKLKKVTIGANVTSIGKEAFSGCKSLKTITIKSKKLKKVGKNAIKGINKKAIMKVPSSKVKAYKKLFKSSTGIKKSMKLKK